MTIHQIISKYYPEFLRYTNTRGTGQMYDAREHEDVLHDVMQRAIQKYGEEDLREEEVLSYLKLNLVRELNILPRKTDKKVFKISDLKKRKPE